MTVCYICSQDVNENSHILSPCDHEYHAGCLINWFRTNLNTFCPCCVIDYNTIFNDDFIEDHQFQTINFTEASRCARKRGAPPKLARLYAGYKKLCFKQKQNLNDIKKFEIEHGNEFRFLRKKICGLRRKRNILRRKITRAKKKICYETVSQ
jgi:hypothetical protein